MSRDEWRKRPFAQVAEINPRRSIKKGEAVPYVEMAALPTAGPNIQYVSERVVSAGGSRFQNGDTLFARITPCAENGKVAFVDCLPDGRVGAGSTEFIIFGPRENVSDPAFIYHLARSHLVRKPALGRMIGTTGRQRVPNYVFDEIEVPLPPLETQRRIAQILTSVDDAIQATNAAIEQTRTVRQGVLERLLTKGIKHTEFKHTEIGAIPETWEVVPLGRIAGFQPGYAFKSADFSDDGDRLLRGSNVAVGKLRWESQHTKHFPPSRRAEFHGYILHEGDIVIAMDRPFISEGFKTARLTRADLPALLLQRVGRFQPSEMCDPDWLWQVVSSGALRRHLEQSQVGTDLPHISKSDIETCVIAVPPLGEQKHIAAAVRELDAAVDAGSHQLATYKSLKPALTSDLLTGRKRVTTDLLMAAE